jgi:hypothetical protein
MLTDNKCEYWCKNEPPKVVIFRFSISRYFEGLFIDNFRGEYGGLMQKGKRSRGPLPHSSLSGSDLRGLGSNLWGIGDDLWGLWSDLWVFRMCVIPFIYGHLRYIRVYSPPAY